MREQLHRAHSEIDVDQSTLAYAAALLVEGLCEREPEWFAIASLCADVEDVVRWTIEKRVRGLS